MSSWCPPLFDQSPNRQTKRLFLYASDGISNFLRSKFKIAGYVTCDYDYMAHMAWLIGGSSAAQSLVREVSCVKEHWGTGDDDKALSLTKVAAMHMISVWFRSIESGASVREKAHEAAASSMASVINQLLCTGAQVSVRTRRDADAFVNMNIQWNWENDNQGAPLTYAALLLARVLEVCGQPCIDWARVAFPVASLQDLLDARAIQKSFEPVLSDGSRTLPGVLTCLEEGVRAVRRYYSMNMEGKIKPSVQA